MTVDQDGCHSVHDTGKKSGRDGRRRKGSEALARLSVPIPHFSLRESPEFDRTGRAWLRCSLSTALSLSTSSPSSSPAVRLYRLSVPADL
ncbi:hypothetical protein U9M48_025944 [Paspalum notatum var. saurae]|uniref:Uncharacterized protein n=1 Tax=Paspalum notatum var. saurae TaxID=547442 RepID=A0AAQ3TR82_PASNO